MEQSGEGATLQIGKRGSETFTRIYDKRGPVRIEVELKGERAAAAARCLQAAGERSARVVVGIIRASVDFIEPLTGSGNRTRSDLAAWWAAIVAGVDRILLALPDSERTIERTRRWLCSGVGAALLAVIRYDCGALRIVDAMIAEGAERWGPRHEALIAGAPPF